MIMIDAANQLTELLDDLPNWLVLTGAGISADSGIPTYRDAAGNWLRNQPIQHQEFVQSSEKRQRYWGRSMVGWPGVRDARPNPNHLALTRLEASGRIGLIVTQNVDRLHQRAGSSRVVDLHGRLDRVLCRDCGAGYEREYIQTQLLAKNPGHFEFSGNARPDGDADLNDEQVAGVSVHDCEACGGMLMPDVVFFGGSIPRERVERCEAALKNADGLLVIGSSLQVYSGYRFCKQAHAAKKPIVIVNAGATRADQLATLKIERNPMTVLRVAIDSVTDATLGNTQCQTPSSTGSDPISV